VLLIKMFEKECFKKDGEKLCIISSEVIKNPIKDNLGITIPEGTKIYVVKHLTNPSTKLKEMIILIDNGTGEKSLMPRTVITQGQLYSGIRGCGC